MLEPEVNGGEAGSRDDAGSEVGPSPVKGEAADGNFEEDTTENKRAQL
jgi:hypothetical protein